MSINTDLNRHIATMWQETTDQAVAWTKHLDAFQDVLAALVAAKVIATFSTDGESTVRRYDITFHGGTRPSLNFMLSPGRNADEIAFGIAYYDDSNDLKALGMKYFNLKENSIVPKPASFTIPAIPNMPEPIMPVLPVRINPLYYIDFLPDQFPKMIMASARNFQRPPAPAEYKIGF